MTTPYHGKERLVRKMVNPEINIKKKGFAPMCQTFFIGGNGIVNNEVHQRFKNVRTYQELRYFLDDFEHRGLISVEDGALVEWIYAHGTKLDHVVYVYKNTGRHGICHVSKLYSYLEMIR
ncbi:MAG TPA: hypothetical protein VEY51_10885 [Chondromyces sp.]|nr:hypothetical protein [Chondromyces sp.]